MFLGERVEYEHCFVSDFHSGSLYFDAPAFHRLLSKLLELKVECKRLHLVGDLLEGKLNHRGQLYESFPLELQEEIGLRVIEKLVTYLRPERLFVLPGNHDRKYSINLLDHLVQVLRERFDVVYYRDSDFYVVDGVLVIHSVGNTGGSSYTGITPMIMSMVDKIKEVYGVDGRVVVIGHYHKYVSVQHGNTALFLLPSFQYSNNPLREARGMLCLRKTGEVLPVLVQPSRREDIVQYWRRVVGFFLYLNP